MQIISQGAPVPVAGAGDLSAASGYENHSSAACFSPHILEKIVEDVSHGRSFVFPRDVADQIPGIRFPCSRFHRVRPSQAQIAQAASRAN